MCGALLGAGVSSASLQDPTGGLEMKGGPFHLNLDRRLEECRGGGRHPGSHLENTSWPDFRQALWTIVKGI